jgi:hypothetical protein
MHGAGAPDLAAVDRLARLALWAKRRGGRLVVSDLSPRLAELLHLTGLDAQAWGRAAGAGHSASGSGRSEVPI